MIKLIWFVAFVHAQAGPRVINIGETTVFKDMAMCEAFGKVMSDRVADYVRGLAKLDWSDSVAVQFKCQRTPPRDGALDRTVHLPNRCPVKSISFVVMPTPSANI